MNAREKKAKEARKKFQEERRLYNFKKKNYKPYDPLVSYEKERNNKTT